LQVKDAAANHRLGPAGAVVKSTREKLVSLGDGEHVAGPCKEFIQQLPFAARTLVPSKGQPYITRKTVKSIFLDWGNTTFPADFLRQQVLMRSLEHTASRLSIDHTYRSASSLGAADGDALTSHGKAKMTPLAASVLTCVGGHGLVLFAVLVPNDGQEHVVTPVSALWGAELGSMAGSLFHKALRKHVMVGGVLPGLVDFIATDFCVQQQNLWTEMAPMVIDACIAKNIPILIPTGVWSHM
jgi:hypothetical protein